MKALLILKAQQNGVPLLRVESIQHILNCYVISDKIQTVSPSLFTGELDTGYAEEVARYVEQFYTAEELLV